jgi:hypothetical protein
VAAVADAADQIVDSGDLGVALEQIELNEERLLAPLLRGSVSGRQWVGSAAESRRTPRATQRRSPLCRRL